MNTQELAAAIGGPANNLLRHAILAGTNNRAVVRVVRRYGMRLGAARFVAGETPEDCLRVLQGLNDGGIHGAVVLLGEHLDTREATEAVVRQHQEMLRLLQERRVDANDTVKLTSLGLSFDRELAYANIKRIAETAASFGNRVRFDMEESIYVDATLNTYRRLRAEGIENAGTVLQAYLYRSLDDLRSLLPLRPNLRLVKGAYLEPPAVAFPRKADVDANYRTMIELSLLEGGYTAIATHDTAIIDHVKRFASHHGLAPGERYEFQMLYGIRSQLQRDLVRDGYPVRVAVPVGTDWYAYLMRRLAERPANLLFFARNLFRR